MSSRSKAAAKEAVDDATDSATAVKPRRRRGRVAAEARAAASAKDGDDARKASRAVKFKTSFSNTIYDVMCTRGWRETDSETDWDFFWAEREWVYEAFDSTHLESWQRINHFRNGRELCRKDLLLKNLKRRKRQLEREGHHTEATAYEFFPVSFVLPREYAMFVEEFKRSGGVWIMKPCGAAQGRGIFLFTRLSEISDWKTDYRVRPNDKEKREEPEAYVVQRYINNPYLIGQKKFDIRLYVLVTSFSPLQAYLYRSGFARFSHSRYSNDPADIANLFTHLTNVAIQKNADNYDAASGGKWDLRSLKLHMISQYGVDAVDNLFWNIQMIILRSLFAVQPVMINDKHCFELYGYDVMIDDTLKPWLIEVNASPSLAANTREDYVMKCEMLNDTIDCVDMESRLTGDETRVGGFDLIYDNGFVEVDPARTGYSTFLGAAIARTTAITVPDKFKNKKYLGQKKREAAAAAAAAAAQSPK